MRPILEKAGVNVERKLFIHPLADKIPDLALEEAVAWITDIFIGPYRAAVRARNLVTEEMWAKMELFPEDNKDHQEWLIWEAKSTALRKAVNTAMRPSFFKKNEAAKLIVKLS
jgi:hypothetical protein